MTSDHVAVALLAGTFGWKDEAEPTALTRTADGMPFVEFQVQTTEWRNTHWLRTSHLATAHGPMALRIATTFDSGDLVVVSGDLRTLPGCRLAAVSLDVKSAFRIPAVPMDANTRGLNVAYVVGTARDATGTRFRDGTPATVLTVACASPLPSQRVNHHAVVLKGPMRESAHHRRRRHRPHRWADRPARYRAGRGSGPSPANTCEFWSASRSGRPFSLPPTDPFSAQREECASSSPRSLP